MGIYLPHFLVYISSKMSSKDCNLNNRDISNFTSVIDKFPTLVFDLLVLFKTKGSLCLSILICLVNDWTELDLEEFPETIASLPNADLSSVNWNHEKKRESIVWWVQLRDTFSWQTRKIMFRDKVPVCWFISV
jgi:hypothetical protein